MNHKADRSIVHGTLSLPAEFGQPESAAEPCSKSHDHRQMMLLPPPAERQPKKWREIRKSPAKG
ncbi:hypothetical protein [Novosphingobium lindaniclasticum]